MAFLIAMMAVLATAIFRRHTTRLKFVIRRVMLSIFFAANPIVDATQVALPSCADPYRPFAYGGCFKDVGTSSALEWRSPLDQNAMTIETCTSFCKGNSNRYAGLSYYGVCYCGMTIQASKTDETTCNFPCSGDKNQVCGGDNAMSVYVDPTFPPLGEAKVDGSVPAGCMTDDASGDRALAYRQEMDSATMTNKKCQQQCLDKGYSFSGTEYAGKFNRHVHTTGKGGMLTSDSSQASAGAALFCQQAPKKPMRMSVTCLATGTKTTSAAGRAGSTSTGTRASCLGNRVGATSPRPAHLPTCLLLL